jgi:hypothetical protein
VGIVPLHNVKNPSSLAILEKALNTFLYPLYSALGKAVSAYILIKARSAGLPTIAPTAPPNIAIRHLYPRIGS